MNKTPYWSEHPINILFNPLSLQQLDPFEIDISKILTRLFERMLEENDINFRLGGLAVYSSSIILRLQSDALLSFLQNNSSKASQSKLDLESMALEFILPELPIPLSITASTVSLEDLVLTFRQDVSEIATKIKKKKIVKKILKEKVDVSKIQDLFDGTLVDMQEFINDLYDKIIKIIREKNVRSISFFDLFTDNLNELTVARTFFGVLYLHFMNKIKLSQNDDLNIIISIVD
ncbi:MAG: hypothetical protein ACP6IS_05715 [Candidatus Asgardarchaeia archaeon]